uniref:Protein kinase domain-containing protein n=1 Tax=Macrostomum lignano TaxID=282301 RepID=A0A1I8GH17_9PLAT
MSERSVSLELLAVDGRRFRCRPDPRHFAPVQGRFGRIFRVRISAAETSESTADETAAVYCADKAGRKLLSCFSILAQLKHDNIVRLIAAARDADSAASVCVLMEWIGSALHYLHSRRILHRNVKCRSALITESGHTKLAGFTACCLLEEDELDASLDVRQFGCFLVEMATGRTGCKEAPESSTNQLRSLCEACAEQQRPRMEQLLQLEFFQTMQSLKPLLSPSPPTPTQALRPVKSDRCLLGGRAEVGASAPEVLLQQRRLGESDATEELDDDDEAGARGLDKYRKTDDEDEDYFELEGTDFEELIEEDENEQDEEDAQACQIDRERLLGRGRFGSVFRADLHGMPAAAYRTTPGCPEETLKQFRASCLILGKLRHDCIVRLVKVLSDSSGCLTVLTELVEGRNLRSILTQRKAGFREGDLRSYCRQVSSIY